MCPTEPLSETLVVDDLGRVDNLSPLERLYSFGKSDVAMHRYERLSLCFNICLHCF